MADRTVTVRPGGGDYTSLNAGIVAEIAANADLTSDNGSGSAGILNFQIESDWSGGADTSGVATNGFTQSATYYANVYTDSANRAKVGGWDTNRYILDVGSGWAIYSPDDYTRYDGLQIESSDQAFRDGIIFDGNSGQASGCRIRSPGSPGDEHRGIKIGSGASGTFNLFNNIISGFDGTSGAALLVDNAGTTVNDFNNILYGNTTGVANNGTTNHRNVASFLNGDDFTTAGTPSITFCASDDEDGTDSETAPGGNWALVFTNPGTGDFSLVASGVADGGGTNDPGSGLYSTDMDGDAYTSTWSIGVDAKTVAAGGIVVLRRRRS